MDFAKVLDQIATFLEERGLRYCVAGAFGLHAHGLTRATVDLDLVVEERAQAALLAFLRSLGYEELHASAGYSNHVHALAAMGRLDFIYVDDRTAEALFRGVRAVELLPGRTIPVPRAEHLAAMKVLAMKNDASRTFREMADIQAILELPGIDEEEIRGYFEKQGLLERFHEIKRAISSS